MRIGAAALVMGAFVWVVALFAAPHAASSSSVALSRGAAGIYAAGAVVCHQRPERSFFIAGRPLPVCARCTGLYLSALAGGVFALIFARALIDAAGARWIVALCSAPTAVTWVAEFAGLIHPSNMTRAIAALPLGAAAAWLVVSASRSPLPRAWLTASGKREAGSA
jgi:uncharacterized membrane protein